MVSFSRPQGKAAQGRSHSPMLPSVNTGMHSYHTHSGLLRNVSSSLFYQGGTGSEFNMWSRVMMPACGPIAWPNLALLSEFVSLSCLIQPLPLSPLQLSAWELSDSSTYHECTWNVPVFSADQVPAIECLLGKVPYRGFR